MAALPVTNHWEMRDVSDLAGHVLHLLPGREAVKRNIDEITLHYEWELMEKRAFFFAKMASLLMDRK